MAGSSEGARKRWATPGYREKMSAIGTTVAQRPEMREMSHNINLGKKLSDETKQKLRDYHLRPEVREADRKRGLENSTTKRPEVRAKISAAARSRVLSEERIEQLRKIAREIHTPEWCKNQSLVMMGDNNPRWRGGISFEPYCNKFTKPLKDYIRQKFHHRCVRCGSCGNGRKLDVHHVDFNKMQGCKGQTWALIPLCRVCHAWTTNHRHDAFNTFINYWAMNSEINFNVNEEFR